MESILAQYENVRVVRETVQQVAEVLEEFPWKEVGQFIRWTTYLEGLGWEVRTLAAGVLLWLLIVSDKIRRTWGLRAYERWNVCCEYLSHLILGVLVGPLYVLICLAQKLMAANRFSDVRRVLIICYVLICFPTLAKYFSEQREKPASAWGLTKWLSW